jgi:hypothetical protein
MEHKYIFQYVLFPALLLSSLNISDINWLKEKHHGYLIWFTPADKLNNPEYLNFFENGITSVKSFFDTSFKNEFDIFIHPSRHSLDSTWQKEWNLPGFKSECWMVASGVSSRLDIISPKLWDSQSCEHYYSETIHTQQLITHELVHVYHGQLNISPDFANTEGIDWFIEGLATFASGQCDSARINAVKKAIIENRNPENLDSFWTGELKYALSGSVVMYIDKKYGREKLKELLPLNTKSQILSVLKTSESDLLENWKKYIQSL